MTKKIASIGIATKNKFDMHKVNADDTTYQKSVNDVAAIAGQKVRFMLFKAMEHLNINPNGDYSRDKTIDYKDTYVSNGDGISGNITLDLRSDFGGYMHTADKTRGVVRKSALDTVYATALNDIVRYSDTMLRLEHPDNSSEKAKVKTDDDDIDRNNLQRFMIKSGYSVSDIFSFGYILDMTRLSSTERCVYESGRNLSKFYEKHVTEDERVRRTHLFIDSTSSLIGMANQSGNLVDNTPLEVFIVFNHDYNSKHINFFRMTETERSNYLDELRDKGVKYFYGNDNSSVSVYKAYKAAHEYLETVKLLDLTDGNVTPCNYEKPTISIDDVVNNTLVTPVKKGKKNVLN
jgi:CRISPR-associated protein Cst2